MTKSSDHDVESNAVENETPVDESSTTRKSKRKVDIKKITETNKLNKRGSITSLSSAKKHIVIGEYDISVPEEKVPLIGVLISAIVLFCALFVDNIISTKYRYTVILCVVAFIAAILSIFIPRNKAITLNYFLFLVTWVGACLLTFGDGPYVQPSNGYFSSWFLAMFSGSASDPPGDLRRRIFDAKVHLASAIIVLLAALVQEYDSMDARDHSERYETEILIGMAASCITLFVMLYFALCETFCNNLSSKAAQAFTYMIVGLLWCITTAIITFRGPFDTVSTGNGYFAAWISAVLSTRLGLIAWQIRDMIDEDE